jgi:hypothetical protein
MTLTGKSMFMSKKGASIKDDYETTEAFDQCDPMVGLAPGFPNEYFDWNGYHDSSGG